MRFEGFHTRYNPLQIDSHWITNLHVKVPNAYCWNRNSECWDQANGINIGCWCLTCEGGQYTWHKVGWGICHLRWVLLYLKVKVTWVALGSRSKWSGVQFPLLVMCKSVEQISHSIQYCWVSGGRELWHLYDLCAAFSQRRFFVQVTCVLYQGRLLTGQLILIKTSEIDLKPYTFTFKVKLQMYIYIHQSLFIQHYSQSNGQIAMKFYGWVLVVKGTSN